MLVPIIISTCVAAGLVCWLLFELAALALLFMVGFTAAGWAYQSGAGSIGAAFAGMGAVAVGIAAFKRITRVPAPAQTAGSLSHVLAQRPGEYQ
ncbi:hypothetical protein [Xanthobacter versatilis]|uniref:hypothetical protein n=1 Tax=Xanthobacter autotrophicus (strain ATCC BAA-1158 / Py2) TaxID=78245 RepID=UPI00372B5F64